MANLFRGEVQSDEIFPYPQALNAEQTETLSMMIDPVSKFFTVSFSHMFLSENIVNKIKSFFNQLTIFSNVH